MTLRIYSRLELAENQLETAIGLFVAGRDKFSVISIAGAADVILSRLVLNSGEENFTDISLKHDFERNGVDATREVYGKAMNDDDDELVDINLEECALGAILKALVNYIIIADKEKDFVLAFRVWMRDNLDPKKYNVNGDSDWEPDTEES